MYIFISHSSSDAAVASDVCDMLEKNGEKCFLAPRDIRSGHEYAEESVDGIDRSDALVLLLSKKSNESPHVLREIERAVSRSIPIIVYKLEEVELRKSMEYFLMTHQWVNAKQGAQLTDLLDCINTLPDRGERRVSVQAAEKADNTDDTDNRDNTEKSPDVKKRRGRRLAAAVAVCVVLIAAVLLWGFAGNGFGRDKDVIDVEAGDTVVFGNYNGEPIEWRVLKVSDDGEEAVLVSKYILTMKAYDAPESGKYNYDGVKDYWSENSEAATDMELQARVRGSNDWSNSTIRTWLNSEDEVVEYEGQAPTSNAMSELKNGYSNEAGFLHDFTDEELTALKTVDVVTKANVLAAAQNGNTGGTQEIITKDRVYLLSLEGLGWFEESGMTTLDVPTDAAIQQDASGWYKIYSLDMGVKEYYWWLREPADKSSSKCLLVGNGYSGNSLSEYPAGLEGFGIRPAVTVDLHSKSIKK